MFSPRFWGNSSLFFTTTTEQHAGRGDYHIIARFAGPSPGNSTVRGAAGQILVIQHLSFWIGASRARHSLSNEASSQSATPDKSYMYQIHMHTS